MNINTTNTIVQLNIHHKQETDMSKYIRL